MNRLFKILAFGLIAMLISIQASAQGISISKSDVERYLKTFRTILDERNALNVELQNLKEPTEEKIASLKQQINDVPLNYDWDDQYDQKVEAISKIFNSIAMMREAESVSDDSRDQRVAEAKKSIDKLAKQYGQKSINAVEKNYMEIDQIIKGLI